jgi:signal transduction histidine kinase
MTRLGDRLCFESELLETVSHELKTSLTVIRTALELPELNRAEVAQAFPLGEPMHLPADDVI